ncbi:MAG: TolC family outer membrane protein [Sedimenticolaceae bacterium]
MKQIALAIALLCHGIGASAADLASVYAMAQKNDPTLAAAQATRDATLEAEPLAKSQLLPGVSLSGEASYTDRDVKDSGPFADDDRFGSAGAALQLVQAIYRKDLMVQLDQSRDQVAQADIDYTTAEQDLIVRVTEAYFGVLSAQDTLTFTEADVKAIARQLDQAKQRFEVGLIAITDVNEAQARYDQARANVIVAQNQLDDAIESLVEITKEPTGPLADLKTSIELKPPQPASLDEWTATALQNNPGVISAKYDAEIALKEIDRQDAADSPALDLVGSYSVDRSDADTGIDSNDAIIGLQLSIPLYTGGGVQAATRQARFQYQAAQDVLEQRRRAVETQVRNAYRGVLASISLVKALEAAEVSSKSALEATEAGFDVGTRTLVDVLDSQRDLLRVQRDLDQSRYEYILNNLSLLQAAGTLDSSNVQNANKLMQQN